MAQLKKPPFDELKIDKFFITHLDKNDDDQVIVRSTVEWALRSLQKALKISLQGKCL